MRRVALPKLAFLAVIVFAISAPLSGGAATETTVAEQYETQDSVDADDFSEARLHAPTPAPTRIPRVVQRQARARAPQLAVSTAPRAPPQG